LRSFQRYSMVMDTVHSSLFSLVYLCKRGMSRKECRNAHIFAYRIKQISPVAPSLTILVSVPRNLPLTSSGIPSSFVVSPS